MSNNNQLKIVIPPEVLAHMEQTMSPSDLQNMLDQFQEMAQDGTLLDHSEAVDLNTLQSDDPELHALLMSQANAAGYDEMEDWISSVAPTPVLN